MTNIERLVKKFRVTIVEGNNLKAHIKGATPQEIKELKELKQDILNFIIAVEEEEKQKELKEKKAFLERKSEYLAGKKVELRYHDGEYLSGYQAVDPAAEEVLLELGLAERVNYWGVLVKDNFADNPVITDKEKEAKQEKEEKKEKEKEMQEQKIAAAQETAKVLGHKVEIYRMTADCDGSVAECSTDIVIGYIDGRGNRTTERIHTY